MLQSRRLWRVTRPLLKATAQRNGVVQARAFVGVTPMRLAPPVASSSPVTGVVSSSAAPMQPTAAASAPAAAATPATSDANDGAAVGATSVGADKSAVITIADVLTHREAEFAEQGAAAANFDEWESVPHTHTIRDTVDMMVEYNMGSLIVTSETDGIVGIVTERDVMKKTSPRAIVQDQEKPVKDIMSAHIMCIPSTTTVIDALATMTKENIRHLAVINGEISSAIKKGSVPEEAMRCVLSIKDIVKAYAQVATPPKIQQQQEKLEQQKQHLAEAEAKVEELDQSIQAEKPVAGKATESEDSDGKESEASATSAAEDESAEEPVPATPVITASTMLKKKSKSVKLILNTRMEDGITVADAVEQMTKHNFGAVLVVDKEQRVLGIFTERDYLTKVLYAKLDPTSIKVTDVCTKKLSCLQIEDTLEQCWSHAAAQTFRHFPVIGTMRKDREKELAGILSIKDLVREISKGHETQSGFRLMDFFKSKMEKKETTPTPAPTPTPAAASEASETKEAVEKADDESAASTTILSESQASTSSSTTTTTESSSNTKQ